MQKINLGSLQLTSRVMNAAGPWAASKSDLVKLQATAAGAVVTKTFTLQPSDGNEEPNAYFSNDFSINSVGLKNRGADYFINAMQALGSNKPIVASIAEDSPEKFLKLVQKVNKGGFSALELNLSCPNVLLKEPVAYHEASLKNLLAAIFANTSLPVGVKLPPYVTRSQVARVATILSEFPVNHLVLINTYPFATELLEGKKVIKPNDGIGGLGGSYLKPIALAHLLLFKKLLPTMPLVGVGGICSKTDIDDFLLAGASAVQIGSALHDRGMTLLDELARMY